VTELAVLGSPIAHSQSPALHAAAYRVLGLDWHYGSADVTGETLAAFVASRDYSWRGLSLTMPLKRDILPLLDTIDDVVARTGAVNTVLFGGADGRRSLAGFNTDVDGITRAFQRAGHGELGSVLVLGGGATAASAIEAACRMSAHTVVVAVRTPSRASALAEPGRFPGTTVTIQALGEAPTTAPDAVVSTLPNGTALELSFAESTRRGAILFDVAYKPWPTTLAQSWYAAGGSVIPGIEMLVEQALVQVRVFVNGSPDAVLDREELVLAAMRAAVID
jgi:shikimate dehydrogenase